MKQKIIFHSTLLTSIVTIITPILTMQQALRVANQSESLSVTKLPPATHQQSVPSHLEFHWEGEPVGRIRVEIAKAISPVLSNQLEGPFDRTHYKTSFNSSKFNKKTAILFTRLLSYLHTSEQRPILNDTHSILDLIELCDTYKITCLNQELSSALTRSLNNPAWYNIENLPLSEKHTDITRMVASCHPYTMAMIQDPKVIQHADWASAVTFSPDSRYVLTISDNNTAKIYDLQTNQLIATIRHDNWVQAAVFSPDGRYVVTTSADKTARITPLGFDRANLPADQTLAIVTLIRLALDRRHDPYLPITLHRNGWVYKTFQQLPDFMKDRLYSQFPEIKTCIDQSVEGTL